MTLKNNASIVIKYFQDVHYSIPFFYFFAAEKLDYIKLQF